MFTCLGLSLIWWCSASTYTPIAHTRTHIHMQGVSCALQPSVDERVFVYCVKQDEPQHFPLVLYNTHIHNCVIYKRRSGSHANSCTLARVTIFTCDCLQQQKSVLAKRMNKSVMVLTRRQIICCLVKIKK